MVTNDYIYASRNLLTLKPGQDGFLRRFMQAVGHDTRAGRNFPG